MHHIRLHCSLTLQSLLAWQKELRTPKKKKKLCRTLKKSLLGGSSGYYSFIFSVWAGKGRRRPSRWLGGSAFIDKGRGRVSDGEGGTGHSRGRMSAGRGGRRIFLRGRNSHQVSFRSEKMETFCPKNLGRQPLTRGVKLKCEETVKIL